MPTVLILSLQYETMVYLYIEHNIRGFAKLTDVGGNGEFSTPKMDMGGNGEFSTKKSGYGWIWIWPNGVEWSGSQNFAP